MHPHLVGEKDLNALHLILTGHKLAHFFQQAAFLQGKVSESRLFAQHRGKVIHWQRLLSYRPLVKRASVV